MSEYKSRQTVLITNGGDRGKYAKLTKILPDGKASVRLEKGLKILVSPSDYVVVQS